jgi:Tfp pilus assembly protein PilN
MPKTIVGLQVSPSRAVSVLLKAGLIGKAVVRVDSIPLSPSGETAERGGSLTSLRLPSKAVVHAALSGGEVFHRVVETPFSDRRRAEAAAPLEAEEGLPLPLERLLVHSRYLGREGSKSRVLVTAAPQESVARRVAEASAAGLHPQSLNTEPLALAAVASYSLPAKGDRLVLDLDTGLCQGVALRGHTPWRFFTSSGSQGGRLAALEAARYLGSWEGDEYSPEAVYLTGPLAAEADLEEWSRLLGRTVSRLPFPARGVTARAEAMESWPSWAIPLGIALRDGMLHRSVGANLLVGSFAPAHLRTPWRRHLIAAGAYGAVVAALALATIWLDVSQKEAEIARLLEGVHRTFVSALPDVKFNTDRETERAEYEVAALKERVKTLSERTEALDALTDPERSPLWALKAISEKIPRDVPVEIRDFQAEGESVRIEGVTASFDAIDRIKEEIQSIPRFSAVTVSDAKAGVDPSKVIFKLNIQYGVKSADGEKR